MSALPSVPASPRRVIWPLLIPAAVALAYACGHLAWYRTTPLGQVPVLDEQENLAFADAIVRGTLPSEPFYRAPGYALLLAIVRALGVPTAGLFSAALFVGAVLHALNATLVAVIARRLFRGAAVALIAGLLFALHPVMVHYATQALDAVPALTLFLLGLCWLMPILRRAPDETENVTTPWNWAGASASWAVAAMFRPNYLLVWAGLLVLAILALRNSGSRPILAAALSGLLVFASVAAWQWRVSGVPGFLPWQGAYNLWAANQPGAHGRYYVQRTSLPAAVAQQNPARAESIYLYRQAIGAAPQDIQSLNAYWRSRFLHRVIDQPLSWLGQLGRKTYALLNNWEQYNNKTFAFHQARSPWLRWNPLGWGILFTLAVAGMARLAVDAPATLMKFALIGASVGMSVVLFFVSARFRLPLAALATLFAAGAVSSPWFWLGWTRRRQLGLAVGCIAAAGLTFSSFDQVRDRATFVQDHALLARAADTVGDDLLTWHEATAALALQPLHRDALRLAVASYFNHLVLTGPINGAEGQWREICERFLSVPDPDARDLQAVAALALWRSDQRDAALAAWRELGGTPSALAARLLLNDVRLAQIDATVWRGPAWDEPLVRLAALRFNLAAPAGVMLGDATRATEVAQRLFATAPAAKLP